MYLVLIGLPLLGSIVSGFFGRKVGVSGAQVITCTCILTTTILAIMAFVEVGLNHNCVKIQLFRWIDSEYLNVFWAFNFDSLTVSMLIPVLIISSLVHIYSIGYMSHDPHNQRFFSYLSLFTFMMIILVTGDNFLVMFVGWEGVGVCSYLLVSFWFTRIAANQSSLAAFFTNRVGDYVLTVGMFAILWSFGNLDYMTVFSLSPFYSESIILFVGTCLLVGAMAKSSQVGLHVWLPMAMEGFFSRALPKFHYMLEHLYTFWSSIYNRFKPIFLNFGKIQNLRQSAGNLLKINFESGSSETTREKLNLDDKFKWWLIGFTEGNGSFIINKDGYLEFKITQSSKDAQILFYIKKQLGFGSVSLQSKKSKTHHFRVRDNVGIEKLIDIFNGNIITKAKIIQFKSWLEAFNNKYKTNKLYIECINKVTIDNAWLSGFTDAQGCFTCSVLTSKQNNTIVIVRYILSQKDDIEFSTYVASILKGYITHIKSYNGYNTIVNFSNLNTIKKYIDTYPLKTKKHISYKRWLKVYFLVKNKKHFTPEGLAIIKFISNIINK